VNILVDLQPIWLPIKFLNRIQINIVNILVDLQPIWLPIKFPNVFENKNLIID